MAVYERTYRAYSGPRTPTWSHFLVITRYAYREVFKTRIFTLFFAGCFLLPLIGMISIYLRHNLDMLTKLGADLGSMLPIDATAFLGFLYFQGLLLGGLLTLIVAPAQISADLRNNALPLYLARPFSRSEYLLGKFSVLAILLSAITWVPGLLLFGLHGYLSGDGWIRDNLDLAVALFLSSWLWISILSLVGLSVSAWVKWKPWATAGLIAIFLVSAGMGTMLNALMDTQWGTLLNVPILVKTIWEHLFHREPNVDLPRWILWTALAAYCGVCLLLLDRKLRAYEVTT